MALGVLVDPPVMDQPDRDGIEKMQLLPARPARDEKTGLLQQAQMLHDPDARHLHLGFELGQRATFTLEEKIEQKATGRVGQRLEHEVVVHTGSVYVTIWLLVKEWQCKSEWRLIAQRPSTKQGDSEAPNWRYVLVKFLGRTQTTIPKRTRVVDAGARRYGVLGRLLILREAERKVLSVRRYLASATKGVAPFVSEKPHRSVVTFRGDISDHRQHRVLPDHVDRFDEFRGREVLSQLSPRGGADRRAGVQFIRCRD